MLRKLIFALALLMNFSFSACENEGPAERAGEQVDEATEKAGEALEKGGEKAQDTAE